MGNILLAHYLAPSGIFSKWGRKCKQRNAICLVSFSVQFFCI